MMVHGDMNRNLPDNFGPGLEAVRRARSRYWISVIAWVFLFALLAAFASGAQDAPVRRGLVALAFGEALGGAAVVAVLWVRLICIRCPRCGEPFFRSPYSTMGVYGRKCVHCGLSLPPR